jgi:large subunit ribosomal protein L2
MRSFIQYLRNSGGRNNTGRTTVRYRSRPVVSRFKIPNGSFNYSSKVLPKRQRLIKSPILDTYLACTKVSLNKYSLGFFSDRFTYSSSFVKFNDYTPGFSVAKLYTIPLGSYVSQVQNNVVGSPKFARAKGSYVQILKRRGSFVTIRLPSGEIRRVNARCFALSSTEPRTFVKPKYYKAGQSRNLGIRPHVRGCAKNPVDHPHGGRTGESRPSVSPWAQLTKGFRTRSRPINKKVVLLSVQQLKTSKKYLKRCSTI